MHNTNGMCDIFGMYDTCDSDSIRYLLYLGYVNYDTLYILYIGYIFYIFYIELFI